MTCLDKDGISNKKTVQNWLLRLDTNKDISYKWILYLFVDKFTVKPGGQILTFGLLLCCLFGSTVFLFTSNILQTRLFMNYYYYFFFATSYKLEEKNALDPLTASHLQTMTT